MHLHEVVTAMKSVWIAQRLFLTMSAVTRKYAQQPRTIALKYPLGANLQVNFTKFVYGLIMNSSILH